MTPDSARKPWWQQATALVTVSTGGVITGFTFAPGTAATMTSPTAVPLHLLALEKAGQPGHSPDGALRSAVVNVARYYLQLAKTRTPAQMEALIWAKDSVDGADHGESCAAFASLALELGAQAVGQQSWVSGGSTYPWPLHPWVDARVDPNPASLGITSILQDAQAHDRWHPLGDGYQPQPGDWVLFDQHVEVVTSYSGGVLETIGGDSLPDYSVNAHSYSGPLAEDGVAGFVDNGSLAPANPAGPGKPASAAGTAKPASAAGTAGPETRQRGLARIPGDVAPPKAPQAPPASAPSAKQRAVPDIPGAVTPGALSPARGSARSAGTIAAAGTKAPGTRSGRPGNASSAKQGPSQQHSSSAAAAVPETKAQQAFISAVAPGAVAAQQRYGIPAAVTIAQAIDESGWGQSRLATQDHNLFGIKGTGPAGTDTEQTTEYVNGEWVTETASFRVYHNIAESIADHAELLATSGYYRQAMADRDFPDAFANDLTGIYATDPDYGANLISLMRLYDLYRYDTASAAPSSPAARPAPSRAAKRGSANIPGAAAAAPVTYKATRYVPQLPAAVATAFFTSAKAPLARAEPLYRDVAGRAGISWKLLAACDWMQCRAQPRYSPVHGEKLGTLNADGSAYTTKSAALAQCAADLIELAAAVYGIDLTARRAMSVRGLADAFAAFRWGGLLRRHGVSSMELPYCVAGLTEQHLKMHWPAIDEPDAPDKPGSRFRMPFGAVPVVLSLKYPATV